ncbi:type I restriction enzyme R subunit [Sinobacterium caligoides]|uniref:Type I restriction enzyme R subunit n=1 Tax=Sinobacterium caligoides TaxID=933926 RepID=A0A3N2DK86_9GAMM|nr:DEAD/DEAH box helicase family protein [Sinobacterium caligoides]ROS00214.1 type I restriction enzyme R subunit [Sinobacterium caligoides]
MSLKPNKDNTDRFSNFNFIIPFWPDLARFASDAEKYAFDDPQSALIKLRCFAEKLTGIVYREFNLPCLPNDKFMDRLEGHAFREVVDRVIVDKLHAIRREGNKAAHEGKVGKGSSQWLIKEAYTLACWLFLTFKKGPATDLIAFTAPQPSNKVQERQAQYATNALKGKLDEQEQRHQQLLEELTKSEAVEQLAQQQAALLEKRLDEATRRQYKSQSDTAKNALELNEAETRRRLIDTELHSRGWDIDLVTGKNTEEVTLEEQVDKQPTTSGIGYVDYVLWDDNGKPLAVIEAKRTRESAKKGRQQAKLYADSLEAKYGQRPVIFYTNGYDISIWDDQQGYAPRELYGFYSKSSLQYLMRQRQQRKDFNTAPIDMDIAGRDYQIETISRVCERFAQNSRKALVVQATGTGKTRVSIALSKRLIDAGWAKRVLFLCDRKELRKQAGNAYTEFLSEPVYVVGKSRKADIKNARIYVATYPGMLRIMQEFDPGYFDLIIADESHRSIYNVFGDVFKYFDALQLGLTATPVEMISRSTSRLFGCDYKMPTANYPLEQAVAEGNLVPFKVVSHTTQFLREGIKGHSLSDEQIAELEDQGKDPNTLDFEASAIDKTVFNKDTNRLILRNLMDNGLRLADGQTLGKSMIFARNIAHAELLAELFTEMYPQYGGSFCRVIHSKYERAEELIDDFKNNDGKSNNVTIAVSVDMLDTGIDVPEVLNLVFAKPVKSKVKFWQMVGRGTRLSKDLFGPGRDKEKFLIFDHWANFEYFELDPEEEERQPTKSLSQKLFEARVAYADEALKKGQLDSFGKMVVLIKQDIDSLDDNNINVKDNWQLKQHLSQLDVIHQFSPKTKTDLLDTLAPLMQWRNIQGQSEALKLDMDIANAQYAHLLGASKGDELQQCRQQLSDKVRNLSLHLNQVRSQAATIGQLQDDGFWQTICFDDLEQARTKLRPVIHLQNKGAKPPPEPINIIDIKEDEAEITSAERKTNIRTVDYEIYRQEVEKTLTPLFDKDPVLQKIRAGESISEQELAALNALVHTQNASVDLQLLAEFFPESSAGVDQLLRTIIGLDTAAIELQFQQFVQQHHISLSALQQRFISLLKGEICRRGEITVADLYDQPFQSLHQDGIDGLFQDEQATLIAGFIAGFTVEPGEPRPQLEQEVAVSN